MQACPDKHAQAVDRLSRQWREVCMGLPSKGTPRIDDVAEQCVRILAAAQAAEPQTAPVTHQVAVVLRHPPRTPLFDELADAHARVLKDLDDADAHDATPHVGAGALRVGDTDAWRAVSAAMDAAFDTVGAATSPRKRSADAPAAGEQRRKRPRRAGGQQQAPAPPPTQDAPAEPAAPAKPRPTTDRRLLAALDGCSEVWEWRYTGTAIDVGRAWAALPAWMADAMRKGVALHGAMGHIASRGELESSKRSLHTTFQNRISQVHAHMTPRALVAPVEVLGELEAAATIARENPDITDARMTDVLNHLAAHADVVVLALRRGAGGVWLVTEGWTPGWLPREGVRESVSTLPPGVECEVRCFDMRWAALPA